MIPDHIVTDRHKKLKYFTSKFKLTHARNDRASPTAAATNSKTSNSNLRSMRDKIS